MFQDVNCVNGLDGWTLAHVASFCGRLDCLQLLAKHHATLDSVDYDGNTPGLRISIRSARDVFLLI